jgi:flagellin
VSFSINTNVASLQAQNYLQADQTFQNQTINEVTSGLRIVNSGDDAAGLAVANGYRSTEAVLTQGIQNASQGQSELQIADGGLSNISQLLDRASTLATESASGTFTGDRSTLNNEYQSVLSEINRQAQSIGLNSGGTFAKNLSVFIGGGNGSTSAAQITNGSVSVDLSNATVDTQSLGLQGYSAGYQTMTASQADSGFYDLSNASATSVSNVIANTNTTGTTSFVISGPGFSGGAGGAITVNVNLANVGDTTQLATAINAGITAAEQTGTAQAGAFTAANIQAVIHTGKDGAQQLQFTSSNSAFEVTAGDATANGLMGNLTGQSAGGLASGATDVGEDVSTASAFVADGTQQITGLAYTNLASNATAADADTQSLAITANNADGVPQSATVTMVAGTSADLTMDNAIAQINQQLQATGNAALQSIVASDDGGASGTGQIYFSDASSNPFTVTVGQSTNTAGADIATTGLSAGVPSTNQSSQVGLSATSAIDTEAGAQSAVSALASAVTTLGNAQAAVGRGENLFNYATNLAQSQLTNDTTAESGIRDANMATEAANLTKAQIMLQAGVAALAQANSAPQNILSLLKG